MLEIQQLRYGYGKHFPPVLQEISFDLKQGEIGILLGKNGAGKTTLFQLILGNYFPWEGTILLQGKNISQMKKKERARKIACVPQTLSFGSLCVFDTILLGRLPYFHFHPSQEDYREVKRIISEMNMEDLSERNVNELSGGERQKVAIARALVQKPQLLLFDEPTGNLDVSNEENLLSMIKEVSRKKKISVFCSLHDLNQAISFGDRFYFLQEGKIAYAVDSEEIDEKIIREVFAVEVEMICWKNRKILIRREES